MTTPNLKSKNIWFGGENSVWVFGVKGEPHNIIKARVRVLEDGMFHMYAKGKVGKCETLEAAKVLTYLFIGEKE
jgi:hypothetical protein